MGLARGASITLATRALALLIGIASSVILARALGPAGRGEYALIVLIPALLQFVGGFGLEPSVTYLVAKRKDEARAIAFTLVIASLALGLLLIGVYAAVSALPAYLRYLQTAAVDPSLVWIVIAILPVTLAAQSLVAAILGLERYRTYNLATLITPAANLALLLALVVALRLGVAGAVVATAAAGVLGLAGAGVPASMAIFTSRLPASSGRASPRAPSAGAASRQSRNSATTSSIVCGLSAGSFRMSFFTASAVSSLTSQRSLRSSVGSSRVTLRRSFKSCVASKGALPERRAYSVAPSE